MKVKCPHCQEEADVALPERGCLWILCGKCKRYYTIYADGRVER